MQCNIFSRTWFFRGQNSLPQRTIFDLWDKVRKSPVIIWQDPKCRRSRTSCRGNVNFSSKKTSYSTFKIKFVYWTTTGQTNCACGRQILRYAGINFVLLPHWLQRFSTRWCHYEKCENIWGQKQYKVLVFFNWRVPSSPTDVIPLMFIYQCEISIRF